MESFAGNQTGLQMRFVLGLYHHNGRAAKYCDRLSNEAHNQPDVLIQFIAHKVIPLVLNIVWMVAALGVSLLVTWALMAPVATGIGEM